MNQPQGLFILYRYGGDPSNLLECSSPVPGPMVPYLFKELNSLNKYDHTIQTGTGEVYSSRLFSIVWVSSPLYGRTSLIIFSYQHKRSLSSPSALLVYLVFVQEMLIHLFHPQEEDNGLITL